MKSASLFLAFLVVLLKLSAVVAVLTDGTGRGPAGPKVSTVGDLTEVEKAIHVLAEAGVDVAGVDGAADTATKVDWGRKDDPAHLVEVAIFAHIVGFDPEDLTLEEDAFLEDAMLFTFNLATAGTDFSGLSSHFVSKVPDDDGDDNDPGDGQHLRGRRRRRKRGSLRFFNSWT